MSDTEQPSMAALEESAVTPGPRRWFRSGPHDLIGWAALCMGAMLALLGLLICLSWTAGVPDLTRLSAHSPVTMFNTALGFIACGVGLAAAVLRRRLGAIAAGLCSALLGLATLAEYSGAVDLGIDQLFARVFATMQSAYPGRMAPNSAAALALAGLGIIAAGLSRRQFSFAFMGVIGSLVGAIGGTALLGYEFDLEPAYDWTGLSRMALLTAIGISMLGVALVLAARSTSGVQHWHQAPWLAYSLGIGLSVLTLLGWRALRLDQGASLALGQGFWRALPNILLALGLIASSLLAGMVAQARDLHTRALQLAAANQELDRSARRTRDLYDAAPCGYHSLNSEGTFVEINQTELEWLGYTREELVGKVKAQDLLTQESLVVFRKAFPDFIKRGWLRDLELDFRRKDGSVIQTLVSASAVLAPDGRFLMSRSTMVDLSERRQAENVRRLLSSVVESSDDAILTLHPGGTITSCNPAAARIFGYDEAELRGRPIMQLVPADRQQQEEMILDRVRRGQHVVQFDTQRLRKDGSVFDISLTNSPIRDSSGTVVAVASIVRDVSVRKRLEQALQESQIELRAFLDGLRAAVIVHGADTRIRFANPEASRLLGLSLPQILGREATDGRWKFLREDGSVMPPEAYPVSAVMLTHAPVLDCVLGVQLPPPGGLRWVLANAVPRLAANGSVREVIVSLADITERRRLEEELARQAGEDALTGLSTRRRFFELADREVRRVQRQRGALSILMLDVDHFKSINDEHGHQAGDAVLQELGHRIREMLRDVDIAGRLGGEEFAIVLPDTAQARAMEVAERLRKAVAQAPVRLPDGEALHFTASIGVSTAEPADRGIDALIARADGALYHAKRSGRNTVRPLVGQA